MRADEEERYVEYVRTRLPRLRALAYLLCQDWHRADDIVQTAITRLYVHWRRAGAADNLDGYARTTVVRVFLGERRLSWSRRVDLRDRLPEVAAPGADADPETRLAVRAALAALPPRQRATLVLRFYLDLSVEQVAESMRCSPGTVKSQTARGLETLRRALDARQVTAALGG